MAVRSRRDAEALDRDDPLAPFRGEVHLPEGVVYLDGNSLGPLPRATPPRLDALVHRQWGEDLIRSWNLHRWIDLPVEVGETIAPLLGAGPGQVVAADSTSVNLFKLLAAALRMRPGRPVILSDRGNFPTDLYIAQGLVDLVGERAELRLLPADEIADAVDERVAAIMLTQVDFRTGRLLDIRRITEAAHRQGALALWDLAHSAGAVPLELDRWVVDLAVGCGYKYLNGGPGAPAFLYVARTHQSEARSPLWGWMGHAAPFAFDPAYRPAPGVGQMLCGTPQVMGLVALQTGADLVARAGVGRLRAKSVALSELFVELVDRECAGTGLELASPRDPSLRGSQVSLRHPEGFAVVQALVERGIIGDFREPDILRFGLAPLFLRFVDVWDAVASLRRVMVERAWDRPGLRFRPAVT